ncbi:hypothetical protein Vau01_064070 [Virgisporangium aurantiacum]|uniref:Uncharacterized protein n=2 Tax=Virgisporangium aurantiacum TaxID=175570 RepID=A0A8J3Z7N7_9ACTN|nr:hypothetical protein Vau01_064070 [Virgisporangium aurantiacum]
MADHDVGNIPLTTFLLAVALTVPWVGQAVCMPLYRVVGSAASAGDLEEARRRFGAAWPTTFLQAAPLLVTSCVPLALIMRWPADALASYLLLVALDITFAQTLVLANLSGSRLNWALAWTGYALPVMLFPTFWFLPPLLGLLTQIVPLAKYLTANLHWMSVKETVVDFSRGFLLGAVLWADKLFYFYSADGDFPVGLVFFALLPAVLAYNYYFICLAPGFDASVARLRTAMQDETMDSLRRASTALAETVAQSVRRTAFLGALFACITSATLAGASPDRGLLIAAITMSSWLLLMITVLSYKLDYIGEKLCGQVVGAFYVALCAIAFAGFPTESGTYLVILATTSAALGVVFVVFRRAWRTPEYNLFWRHALAW